MAHVNDVLSDRTVHKCTRLREAKCGTTVCQFCAVGCSQLAFYKDKELIEVEGDPRSPINAGRQCPKGMSTFMLNRNPYRETRALYRAPGASEWEEKSIDWMLDAIADRIWETRNKGFVEKDENGLTINAATNIGFIGGSALDNEVLSHPKALHGRSGHLAHRELRTVLPFHHRCSAFANLRIRCLHQSPARPYQ